jgi:hemerythrin-like domain-containing protein
MPIKVGQQPDHGFDEPLGLLSDCHRRIEHFLEVLVAIERQVQGGALSAAHCEQLAGAITYFSTAAPRHTADEEQSLFPRLRACADPAVHDALATVATLEREHATADRRHNAVDALVRRWLADGKLTPDASAELREHLAALTDLYQHHIRIEDRELFPAAAKVLSTRELREIRREMSERRSISRGVKTPDVK